MKRLSLTTLFVLYSAMIFSQTNYEIANIYFSKAEKAMEKIDYKTALEHFNKGVKILDTIKRPSIAQKGVFINYELKNYTKAMEYAKQFFNLSSNNKSSERYTQMLELYVDMGEKIAEQEEDARKKAEAKLAKELELKRIDSLKNVWTEMAKKFEINADSIYKFNKNGIAIIKKGNKFGAINEVGEVLVKANEYEYAQANDGYIIFTDQQEEPAQIYCYNTSEKTGYDLPEPSNFDESSTYFDAVMLPRGNGRIALYPNNSIKTIVFDLEAEKKVKIANLKAILKELKKADKIGKYDDDEQTVKINKDWYALGNHLGSGVYSLYNIDEKSLYGYLITNHEEENPIVIGASNLGYVGSFYKNKLQAIKDGETIWINDVGEEGSKPRNSFADYSGETKVVKNKNGNYVLQQNGTIVLGNKTLERLQDFMRKHAKK